MTSSSKSAGEISSIERQANKARKYQEEFKNLERLEVHLAKCQGRFF